MPHPPRAAYTKHAAYTDGPQAPMVVVLHSTESDGKGVAYVKGIGDFLDREQLSVHVCVAADGTIGRYASATEKCRHAPPNTGKVGIEQAGFAAWPMRKWLARPLELHATAKLVAWYSRSHGIPIAHSTTHGVCRHVDLPEGGHHDPGAGYPFRLVLRMARLYRKTLYR